MAERVSVELLDDLDNSPATKTHTVSLDGKTVIVDLNDKNSDKLVKFLATYLEAGRPPSAADQAPAPRRGRPAGSTKRAATTYPAEFTDNRHLFNEWLGEQGEKPARGRVSIDKANAFAEAIKGGWSPKQ